MSEKLQSIESPDFNDVDPEFGHFPIEALVESFNSRDLGSRVLDIVNGEAEES